MILLLDAHALLWALVQPDVLKDEARASIASPANEVVASAASIWELEIKRARGKLRYDVDLALEAEALGVTVLPITSRDAVDAARLAPHHHDPFDRMLIAQGRRLEAVIVTRDRAFDAYDVAILAA